MHNCKKYDLSMNAQIMEFYYRHLTTKIYNNVALNVLVLSKGFFQRKQISGQST